MIRATYGATAMTKVSVGKIRTFGSSHGWVPGGPWLMAGSHVNTEVANRMTNSTATTNSGSAASSSNVLLMIVSKSFSRRRAAYEPIAIDSGIDTTAAH